MSAAQMVALLFRDDFAITDRVGNRLLTATKRSGAQPACTLASWDFVFSVKLSRLFLVIGCGYG